MTRFRHTVTGRAPAPLIPMIAQQLANVTSAFPDVVAVEVDAFEGEDRMPVDLGTFRPKPVEGLLGIVDSDIGQSVGDGRLGVREETQGLGFGPTALELLVVTESNAEDLIEEVRTLEDAAVLDRLHLAERSHPKYDGGRSTVLDAIEERKGELATVDANEAGPKTPDPAVE